MISHIWVALFCGAIIALTVFFIYYTLYIISKRRKTRLSVEEKVRLLYYAMRHEND